MNIRLLAALAGSVALAGCAPKVSTIPPNFAFASAPGQGVVIGLFSAEGASGGVMQSVAQTVVQTDTGKKLRLGFVDGGLKSVFYVALPAGRYRFAGGEIDNLTSTAIEWNDVGVTFNVTPNQVTCIGSVVFEKKTDVGSTALGMLSSTIPGQFAPHDLCDDITGQFKQKYPTLGADVKKDLATRPE